MFSKPTPLGKLQERFSIFVQMYFSSGAYAGKPELHL